VPAPGPLPERKGKEKGGKERRKRQSRNCYPIRDFRPGRQVITGEGEGKKKGKGSSTSIHPFHSIFLPGGDKGSRLIFGCGAKRAFPCHRGSRKKMREGRERGKVPICTSIKQSFPNRRPRELCRRQGKRFFIISDSTNLPVIFISHKNDITSPRQTENKEARKRKHDIVPSGLRRAALRGQKTKGGRGGGERKKKGKKGKRKIVLI